MARKTASLRKSFVKIIRRVSGQANLAILGESTMSKKFGQRMKKVLRSAEKSLKTRIYTEFGEDKPGRLMGQEPKSMSREQLLEALTILEPFKSPHN